MEEILKEIEKALAAKGLSAAAASQLAAGNPSVIKNLMNRRGETRSHPIENLLKVADVLGLEVYVGPPRKARATGFAEDALAEITPAIDGSPEALRQGYFPVPYHEEASPGAGLAPIAFSRAWMAANGIAPETASIIRVPSTHAGCDLSPDDLVLVDTTAPAALDGRVFAYFNGLLDGVRFARLFQLPTGPVVSVSGDPVAVSQVEQRRGFRVLGVVATVLSKRGMP